MVRRSAFTFIELIFAIVIIAISVLSLPMMSSVISKGISSSLVQEAIFAAATELNEVTTAHWDDNSLEAGAANSFAKVIDSGTCENNSSLSRYRLMPGHIEQPLHRRCLDSNATAPADASTVGTVQALDDYVHAVTNIFTNNTNSASGYKDQYDRYQSTLSVTRPANFNGSNVYIKKISSIITKTSDPLTAIVTLSTYSANIGEVDFYKKVY